MGFLTTVTFYNDGADMLQKHPEELAKILTDACHGVQINRGENFAGLGYHSNLITLQKPRHADNHTLYLHAGNTVVDIAEAEESEWALNQFISEMEYQLKRLKKLKK